MYLTEETKVKTEQHLRILLTTTGANDIDFTEGRIANARKCICDFMSQGYRTTPITPCQELQCSAP